MGAPKFYDTGTRDPHFHRENGDGVCHEVYGPPQKSSPHIAFVWGTNISEFLDPPSNSAKAKAWARARARVETRPRANARARVRDRIRARATELGLEGGNNF